MLLKQIYRRVAQVKPRLFVFGGQGTQQKGLLDRLLLIPEAKSQIVSLSSESNIDFIELGTTDREAKINNTMYTQPLLVLSHYLHFKYGHELQEQDFMIGHSVGQYSALTVAKSLSISDCIKIVSKRGELMTQFTKSPHGMLIVKFNDTQKPFVLSEIEGMSLSIASYNTPNNIIVAGQIDKLEKLKNSLKASKVSSLFLPVSTAFHCAMLEGMKKPYADYLSSFRFRTPACTILRNIDCAKYEGDQDIKQGLIEHLTSPVMFSQSVSQVSPQHECIEIGHKSFVKKFVDETRSKQSY